MAQRTFYLDDWNERAVDSPTFREAYGAGIEPLLANQIQPAEAFNRAATPFRTFMLKHVREKDLGLFMAMSKEPKPERPTSPRKSPALTRTWSA